MEVGSSKERIQKKIIGESHEDVVSPMAGEAMMEQLCNCATVLHYAL